MPEASPQRSGSEKRRRTFKTDIRWDGFEYVALREKAGEAGLTVAAYVRTQIVGSPGPRAQRTPPVNAEAIARATAALNKMGSNINQIAHTLNAGGAISMASNYLETLTEIRAAVRAILEATGRGTRHDRQGQSA